MEEEKDYGPFETAIHSLFNVSREIMKTYFQRNIMADKRDPISNRLEMYVKTYKKTDPSEHAVYFNRIYQSNKRMILLGPQRDTWLQEGKISITYGEDCGIKTDIILHLSMIYINACRLRQEIQDEPNDLPLTDNNSSPALKYPGRMLLYLYQIFHEITDSKVEKEKLMSHINNLSEEYGENRRNNNDPLGGIFDSLAGIAEQATGQKLSRDKMPDTSQINNMMSSLIKDPKTQNLLGGMMKDMKGANSLQDILGGALKTLGSLAGEKAASTASEGTSNSGASENGRNTLTSSESVGDVNDEFADFE